MTDYIMVPVEPTAEMVEAAREHHEGDAYLPVSLYRAMLAAAPAVQGEPTDDELLDWAGEEQFFLFCDKDEFLQIARAVMHRYMGRKTDVQGEPVEQHHRDSAELRRLCKARDEQRDGRLAALERAAKAEADVVMLLGLLDGCLNSMRNAYPDYDHYESNAYIAATAVFENRTIGKYPPLYVAPQPTERQPAPDEAGLVEALDLALEYWRDRQQRYKNRRPKWVIAAESALAAHRKQQEGGA